MDWNIFCEQYIDDRLMDRDERPRTLKALQTACERIPEDVWAHMPCCTIFAPPAWYYACVQLMPAVIIYFAPVLEQLPQRRVDFTVAHQFAHLVLGHRGMLEQRIDPEREADKLAISWGYPLPSGRRIKN